VCAGTAFAAAGLAVAGAAGAKPTPAATKLAAINTERSRIAATLSATRRAAPWLPLTARCGNTAKS
jgi:hypothetical protein